MIKSDVMNPTCRIFPQSKRTRYLKIFDDDIQDLRVLCVLQQFGDLNIPEQQLQQVLMNRQSEDLIKPKKDYKSETRIQFFQGYCPDIKVCGLQPKQSNPRTKLSFEYSVNRRIQSKFSVLQKQLQRYNQLGSINLECEYDQTFTKIRLIRDSMNYTNLYNHFQTPPNIQLNQYLKPLADSLSALHSIDISHNLIRLQTVLVQDKKNLVLDLPYFELIARYCPQRENYFSVQNVYCAPQMRLSEKFSKEGDIYALGVVFLQVYLKKIVSPQQLNFKLRQLQGDFQRDLIRAMLDPNPANRPNSGNVASFLGLKQFIKHKIKEKDTVALQKQSSMSIYKRQIFSCEYKYLSIGQVQHGRQESFQSENNKIFARMLSNNTLRLSVKTDQSSQIYPYHINIVQNDQTILSATDAISSVQNFYSLFENDEIQSFQLTGQGFLQIFVSSRKWFQLKIRHEKLKFAKLGIVKQADQNSQKYRNFSRLEAKSKRNTLIDNERIELTKLQQFWPEVAEDLIDRQLYLQAAKLSRFNIQNYPQKHYEFKGYGCHLQTKGLSVNEIVAYYNKSRNPYEQLAICGIILNNSLSNYHFLKQMEKKEPNNPAVLFSLGCIEYNQQNLQTAVQYFSRLIEMGFQVRKVSAFRLLCLYQLRKRLSASQIAEISKLLSQLKQDQRGFDWLLLELLLLASQVKKQQNIKLRLMQIKQKANEHHQKLLYFIFGTLMEEVNQEQLALQVYEQYKKLNPGFPFIYKITGELKAVVFSEDISQALSDYIYWHSASKKQKQQQKYSVKAATSDKQISKIDVYSKDHSKYAEEGVKCLKQSNFHQAIKNLQLCLVEYKDNPAIYYNLAVSYRRSTLYDEARRYIQKVIELVPQSSKAHYILGLIYEDLGQKEESLACFQRAYQINPHQSSITKLLFDSDAKGEFQKGLRYIQAIIELEPDKFDHYLRKANLLFGTGQVQRAQLLMQFAQQEITQDSSKLRGRLI